MSDAFQPTPIPWSDFPAECLWYFVLMSPLHLILFVAFCAFVGPLPWWQPREFRRAALFFGLLLFAGSFFSALWNCLVYGRLYYTVDLSIEFIPFWPVTKWNINETWGDRHGGLIGVTFWQLQLVWLLFALGTWSTTVYLYRWICGQWPLSVSGIFHRSASSNAGA